jgi:hypothetical protein
MIYVNLKIKKGQPQCKLFNISKEDLPEPTYNSIAMKKIDNSEIELYILIIVFAILSIIFFSVHIIFSTIILFRFLNFDKKLFQKFDNSDD